MSMPIPQRPIFPPGYVDAPKGLIAWTEVVRRLTEAKNYWLGTVRPNGHPHVVPKWGVWVHDRFYFDGSPATRHARNLALNPHVTVHLESGDEAVIVEGVAQALAAPAPELAGPIAQAYRAKYATLGYAPEPTQWDAGGLFEVRPRVVLAWTKFTDDPTKFVLKDD
jgi:nitroimidazol reductase NimA-like FMN-containing flavoprotein (pyridoxamine 5'-phosphate oxidase superfamily)